MAKEALTSTLTATVPTTVTTTNGQTDRTTEEPEVRVGAEVREAEAEGRAKGDAEQVLDAEDEDKPNAVERSDRQSNVVGQIQSLLACSRVVQTAPPFRALECY